jgi:hypothetical protein
VIAATTREVRLPRDGETRIAEFTELVATAIANASGREALTASRARVVVAADEARRRIERNLHDGAQQQLIGLALQLRIAATRLPPGNDELRAQLTEMLGSVAGVHTELQEISRGLHPAVLYTAGLEPALGALARRSPVPVELQVETLERFPEPVEVAAYYVASEALANAAKHGQAESVTIGLSERAGIRRAGDPRRRGRRRRPRERLGPDRPPRPRRGGRRDDRGHEPARRGHRRVRTPAYPIGDGPDVPYPVERWSSSPEERSSSVQRPTDAAEHVTGRAQRGSQSRAQ